MENNLLLLMEKVSNIYENQKKFVSELKKIIESDDDNLSKKVFKHLKKLEFYLEGGEEMFKDVLKTIEKAIEKSKEKDSEDKQKKDKKKDK